MAKGRKVIITCAVTGSIHTPSMSPHLPITARRSPTRPSARPRRAPRSCTCTRATRKDGRPDQSPEAFAPFLKVIKQRSELRGQHHHRRRADHDDRGAREARRDLQAGGGVPQHGLHELRPLPDAGAAEGVQARLGEALSRRLARAHLQEHLRRHRVHPHHLRQQRHALRDRVLRHRPPLHAAPLRRPRRGQAAVLHPVGVRHPRRHRPASRGRAAHEAHGRPPVRRRVSLERAGRGPQPDADRGAVGWPWAATCASAWRTRSGSARASSPRATPSR